MKRPYAEKHPNQRERLRCFPFVFIVSPKRQDISEFVLSEEPNANCKQRELSDLKFYLHRNYVFVKDEEDAMKFVIKFELEPFRNPNLK